MLRNILPSSSIGQASPSSRAKSYSKTISRFHIQRTVTGFLRSSIQRKTGTEHDGTAMRPPLSSKVEQRWCANGSPYLEHQFAVQVTRRAGAEGIRGVRQAELRDWWARKRKGAD